MQVNSIISSSKNPDYYKNKYQTTVKSVGEINMELQTSINFCCYQAFIPLYFFVICYILYYMLRDDAEESAPGASISSWPDVLILSQLFYFYCVSFGF